MPLSYQIPSDGRRSDALKKRALQSIPPDARSPTRPQEDILAVVWALVMVDCQLATWLRMAWIKWAVGAWLDLHGGNYGKLRRSGELDDVYRDRIPKVDDACTPTACVEAARDALAAGGIAGDVYLTEVWASGLFCDVSSCDNTSEVLGPGPTMLFSLPPATTEAVARSAYEAIRDKKLGGVYILVFPSTTGGKP